MSSVFSPNYCPGCRKHSYFCLLRLIGGLMEVGTVDQSGEKKKKKRRNPKNRKNGCCLFSGPPALPSPSCSPSQFPVEPIKRKPFNCNLDRFLISTCPAVQAQFLAKTCGWKSCQMRNQNQDPKLLQYFTLGDLWDSLIEWSVYGVGVPISLKGSEHVVQYYVPYLSALQLYTRSTRQSVKCESDVKLGVDDCDIDGHVVPDARLCQCGKTNIDHHCSLGDVSESLDCCCGCDKLQKIQDCDRATFEDASNDNAWDWNMSLLFEYFESSPPYARTPLSNTIENLARGFPELRSLRSVDLLPASWISIAWYPIYRIPTGATLQDLDACFLTFHELSTSLQDGKLWGIVKPNSCPIECRMTFPSAKQHIIHLCAFGLAHYKLRGSIWTSIGNQERRHASSMYRCAESWLKYLNVGHPDLHFFQSHNPVLGS